CRTRGSETGSVDLEHVTRTSRNVSRDYRPVGANRGDVDAAEEERGLERLQGRRNGRRGPAGVRGRHGNGALRVVEGRLRVDLAWAHEIEVGGLVVDPHADAREAGRQAAIDEV